MNKIKIVLFFTFDISLKIWENLGLLKRELIIYENLMKKYNCDITLITYGDNKDLEIEDINKKIKIFPVYSKFKKFNNRFLQLFQSLLIPFFIGKYIKNCDLIKTNQMWGSWVAVIASYLYRKPLLLRTGYELYNFSLKQNKLKAYQIFVKLISTLAYKTANFINVATKEDKELIIDTFKLNNNKIDIRPNWIDTDLFIPLKIKKKKSILLVGRIESQKNYSFIIKSLYKTNIELFIVGEGSLKKSLSNLAKNLDVKVNFLNNIPNDKMPTIYNRHSIYVICSKYEGNPKTLLEAMSCGSSVIGANTPGINSIIEHNKNGIKIEFNQEELKRAIKLLMKNSILVKKMNVNARKYILENNSLKTFIDKEYQTYLSMIK